MPAPTPDADLATKIATALGAGYTVGTNIFVGAPRKIGDGVPHLAIFCNSTGGPSPYQFTPGAGSVSQISYYGVQVFMRGNVEAFLAGQTIVRAIRDGVHKATVSGYINCEVVESDPNFIGEDDLEHPMWTLNVKMWREV